MKICLVEDCGKPAFARGWCRTHYQHWYRDSGHHGSGTVWGEPIKFIETVVIRFKGTECLIWPYGRDGKGYGRILRDGKRCAVPRIVCERVHGPAPTPKHEVAHSCGHGHLCCANPKHLRWATRSENHMDKVIHGTHSRGERSSNAKLTESNVHEIRRLRGEVSQRKVANMFGVSVALVCLLQRGKRWSWLEETSHGS